MTSDITSDLRGQTLWVTFNRPEARNALTFDMYEGLAEICSTVPEDGSVKALVIVGAGGKAFAAGTDMTQFRTFETEEDAWAYEDEITRVLTAVDMCPVPTIAAIHGACTGGGASIAASCDMRICSAQLKFGFPIARTLGNCLNAGNLARLTELMGAGRVRDMIFTARLVGAEEAMAIGLVSEVLADEDTLLTRADELAEQLGGMAPLTLRATKEAMRRNRDAAAVDDKDLIALCYMSQVFKHGLEAFLACLEDGKKTHFLYTITDFEFPPMTSIGVEFSYIPLLLQSLSKIGKVAVVADQAWLSTAAEVEGKLIPGLTIQSYEPDQAQAAETWVLDAS